jgi:hypothetical protein
LTFGIDTPTKDEGASLKKMLVEIDAPPMMLFLQTATLIAPYVVD